MKKPIENFLLISLLSFAVNIVRVEGASTQKPNHLIKFLGFENGYETLDQAREELRKGFAKLFPDHQIQIESYDGKNLAWYSENLTALVECPEAEVRSLLERIKVNNELTREFKMYVGTENFVFSKRIDIDWLGSCANVDRKRSDPASSGAENTDSVGASDASASPASTTTVEPSAPATTPDSTTVAPEASETTTAIVNLPESTTTEANLAATIVSESISPATTTTTTTVAPETPTTTPTTTTTSAPTTTTTAATTTTATTTVVASESTTTPATLESTIKGVDGDSLFDSKSFPSMSMNISAEENSQSSTAENSLSTTSEETPPEATLSAEKQGEDNKISDAIVATDEPHYGKYIGVGVALLILVAYLVCSHAYSHERRGMYELHNE